MVRVEVVLAALVAALAVAASASAQSVLLLAPKDNHVAKGLAALGIEHPHPGIDNNLQQLLKVCSSSKRSCDLEHKLQISNAFIPARLAHYRHPEETQT